MCLINALAICDTTVTVTLHVWHNHAIIRKYMPSVKPFTVIDFAVDGSKLGMCSLMMAWLCQTCQSKVTVTVVSCIVIAFGWYLNGNSCCLFSSTVACWHMWYSASAVQWYVSVILWTLIQLSVHIGQWTMPIYSVIQLSVSISQWTVLLYSTVLQYASEYRRWVQWMSLHCPIWWWSGALCTMFWTVQKRRW